MSDAASGVGRMLVLAFAVLGGVAAAACLLAAVGGPTGFVVAIAVVGAASATVATAMLRRVGGAVEELRDGLEGDLREAREAYDRARLDARMDPLTGLANHRAFQEELGRQIADATRSGRPLALAILDLDDLKRVNDADGHAAGDELLADRWTARRGHAAHDRSGVPRRRRRVRAPPARHRPPRPRTASSGGCSPSATGGPPGPPRPRAVLVLGRHLDRSRAERRRRSGSSAMPTPRSTGRKRHGRTDVQVFDPARHGSAATSARSRSWPTAVARVGDGPALRPVYQPIISLPPGRPIGFEGLVRPTARRGVRQRRPLFTAAEVADRIVELDMAAIETHCRPGRAPRARRSPRA